MNPRPCHVCRLGLERCEGRWVPRVCELTDPAHPDFIPEYAVLVRRLPARTGKPPEPATIGTGPARPGAVVIRTYLNILHGYTQIGEHLGRGLELLDVPVAYLPISIDESYAPMPPWQKERIVAEPTVGWVLQLAVPRTTPLPGCRTISFSMWEASRLLPGDADALNQAEAVIVPCTWNVEVFRASGVTRPIRVVPMGIDPGEYYPTRPMAMDGPTVFGMAARVRHGPIRKGLREGIEAFRRAFPRGDEDVELRIKILPDCPFDDPHLPRVTIDRTPMPPPQMRAWYAGLTALLVPSKGEGWGLHTHQALACARPVLAAFETGTKDFANEACGCRLEGSWEPAGEFYEAPEAEWFAPSIESMVGQLRRIHRDRDEARAKGEAGARRALEFTWPRTGRALAKVLEAVGMREPKPRVALGTPHCVPCVQAQKAEAD